MRTPELLAPAGSHEALVAAVRCGADAVYLGTGTFNARRNAQNFDGDALETAVRYCHAHGAAVHLTLNTLVFPDETSAALRTAALAAEVGVDALIVQDLGLARRLRAACPSMTLHASTQLSCHSPAGVRTLYELGFSRVVLAREMTREEIAACCGQGAEIEIFVHGALCMSVSGQCYLSAQLGGRSGNRGLCAQPCRLPWTAADGAASEETALSLKDLSLLQYAEEFAEMGIASLKIEGRMKRPEYVAAAVSVCRAALDGKAPDERLQSDLQAVFSRSGFTDGYYTGRRDGTMFGRRRHEDVTAAAPVLGRLGRLYDREVPRIPVYLSLTARSGLPVSLTACDAQGHNVCVTGDIPAAACGGETTAERAAAQLTKTGGTPYVATADCCLEAGLFLPSSALNALRREALEALTALRGQPVSRPFHDDVRPFYQPCTERAKAPALWVRVTDAAQLTAAKAEAADAVFVPLEARALWDGADGVELPRGLFGMEETVVRLCREAADKGIRYAVVHNIGAVAPARKAGLTVVGGFGLNIANADALQQAAFMGLSGATLSMELTFRRMAHIPSPIPVGAFLYGRQPLMLMRNCPRMCAGGCATCSDGAMTDRTGAKFPTRCSGAAAELLGNEVLYWADRRDGIPPLDFWWLSFTDESAERTAAVLADYRCGGKTPEHFTRGLYKRGVE